MQRKVFRPFVILQIPQIEHWLKQQSKQGWKLIAYKRGWFTFEECKPREREYFVFSEFLLDKEGEYSGEFFSLKHQYAIRKSASALNASNDTIIEIRVDRIDHDYGYFRPSRTRYYLKWHLRKMLYICIPLAMILGVAFFEKALLPFALLLLLPILYSCIAALVLRRQEKNYLKGLPATTNSLK